MRFRRRTELPVLPIAVARHAAMVDAEGHGILAAQARTRDLVDSAAAAWVGLVAAPTEVHVTRNLLLVDRAGVERKVEVTIYAPAAR